MGSQRKIRLDGEKVWFFGLFKERGEPQGGKAGSCTGRKRRIEIYLIS
jgi:hypothetical protein